MAATTAATIRNPPTHIHADGAYFFSVSGMLFYLRAGEIAAMPARHWLFVPLLLKQALTPVHLGIARVLDFEPCANGVIGEIRRCRVLCHDALEIHFADTLENGYARSINLVSIVQSRMRSLPGSQARATKPCDR